MSRKPHRNVRLHGSLAAAIFTLSFALGSMAGCRQIIGIHGVELACGSMPYAVGDCAACMDGGCCDEQTACAQDRECADSWRCTAGCEASDATCRIACDAQAPVHNDRLSALRSCGRSSCALECSSCGGFVDAFGAECDECVRKTCCESGIACDADELCVAQFAGLRDCVEAGCIARSIDGTHDDPAMDALNGCITRNCVKACGIGRDWTCVGDYAWTRAPDEPLPLTIRVLDIVSRAGVANASVSLCSTYGSVCAADGTTDADGNLPLILDVAHPYQGFIRLKREGYVPALVFGTRPFERSETRAVFMATQEAIDSITSQFGVDLDPERGMLTITGDDCKGFAAPGVSFDISNADEQTLTSYLVPAGQDSTQTTQFGTAAFGNVPLTNGQLAAATMFLDETDEGGGITILSNALYQIEKGTVTELLMYPRPAQ